MFFSFLHCPGTSPALTSNAVARLNPTQSHTTRDIDWLRSDPAKLDAVLHHALQLAVLD